MIHSLKNIFVFFGPYKKWMAMLFVLILLINVASLATPYVLKIIIDDILPHGRYKELIIILFALLSIYIFRVLLSFLFDILYTKTSQRIVADLRQHIMEDVFSKPIGFFQKKQIGETIYLLSNDVNNVLHSLSYIINDTVNNIILIFSILGFMFFLNVNLTWVCIAILPFIVFLILRTSPLVHSKVRNIQISEERLFSSFTDQLKNIRLIKTFNSANFELKKIKEGQNVVENNHIDNIRLNSFLKNIITLIVASIPLLILGIGGKEVIAGALTIGGIIAYIQYVNRLLPPVTSIANGYNTIIKSSVSMDRINKFLIHLENHTQEFERTEIENINKIEFLNVGFSYEKRKVFKGLNLEFNKGKTYLISGESGSGKSTILGLISNLLYPSSGQIIINGTINLKVVSNLSNHLCLIEKDHQIFTDTIFNNVKYGSFDATSDQVNDSLDAVNLTEKLRLLENGMNTVLNSSSNSLSEGQRQRISLARLFLKSYSVIIIDEATASLDIANERKILKNIRKRHPAAIIILISHRNSFDDLCEKIYHFDKGNLTSKSIENAKKIHYALSS